MTRMHPCAACGREYPSYLAAEDCADQDDMEADDRTHGRLYGIHRSIN